MLSKATSATLITVISVIAGGMLRNETGGMGG